MKKTVWAALVSATAALILAACGGGGGSTSTTASGTGSGTGTQPSTTISGSAIKGPVANATVTVKNAATVAVLGTATTNSAGAYTRRSIRVPP